MEKTSRLFVLVLAAAILAYVCPVAKTTAQNAGISVRTPEKRILMSLAWAGQLPNAQAASDYAAACRERGINGCGMQVLWNRIEPDEGKYAWEWLDERLDALVNAGQMVHLRLAVYRDLPAWVKPEYMCGADGATLTAYRSKQVSYADRKTMSRVAGTMRAVMEHVMIRYKDINPHPIVAILSQHTASAETEYAIPDWSDFSQIAQEDFRAWLKGARFSNMKSGAKPADAAALEEMNNRWDTRYKEWGQVTLQAAPIYDFQAYREFALVRFIRECAEAVHAVPNARLAVQFGSVWDDFSPFRGTRDVRTLIEPVDLVMVDDSPIYNFAFSMDYIRSMAWDKLWGNEIDGPNNPYATDERFRRQGIISAQRGVKLMFAANWDAGDLRDKRKWTFWEPVIAELAKPAMVQPRKAIVVSTASLWRDRREPKEPYGEELAQVSGLYKRLSRENRDPVDFVSDAVLIHHPERIKIYSEGLFIPDSQKWMTDELVMALSSVPTSVFTEGPDAGLLDEYGTLRSKRPSNWKQMAK